MALSVSSCTGARVGTQVRVRESSGLSLSCVIRGGSVMWVRNGARHCRASPVCAQSFVGDDRVAVAASDIALSDLFRDHCDAESVSHELHDAVTLDAAWPMIEIEHSEVGIAAIDARMVHQIMCHERSALGPLRACARSDRRNVMLVVLPVVAARRRAVALATHLLTPIGAR